MLSFNTKTPPEKKPKNKKKTNFTVHTLQNGRGVFFWTSAQFLSLTESKDCLKQSVLHGAILHRIFKGRSGQGTAAGFQ